MNLIVLAYAAGLFAVCVVVAYILSGKSVFGTAGHTSSEFKVVAFANVNLVAAMILAGITVADNATLAKAVAPVCAAAWYSVAIVDAAYIIGRSVLKNNRK